MNPKTLLILTALAGVVIVGAVLAVNSREASGNGGGEDLPQLITAAERERIEDTQTIRIESAEETITLERTEAGEWTVEENAGYVADSERVGKILRGFALMEVEELKTANPQLFDRLEVRDPEEDDSKGVRVTLLDEAGETIQSAVVGRTSRSIAGGQSLYVRVPEIENVLLVRSPLEARGSLEQFTRTEVFSLPRESLLEVKVTRFDGQVTHIDRPTTDTAEWSMVNVPEGYEVTSASRLRSFVTPLQTFRHDGVQRVSAWDELTTETTVMARTADGMTVEAVIRQNEDGEHFARFSASVAENAGNPEEAREAAEKFNAATEGFVFKLTDWQANSFLKDHEELLRESDPVETASASHILVAWEGSAAAGEDISRTKEEARTKAAELRARLAENPDDFEQIAREESEAAGATETGGSLGAVTEGTMEDAFEAALFALEPGEISEVVETRQGFHIIRRDATPQ